MKAFVIKQHEKTAPIVRAIRDEELKTIAGGLLKDTTTCPGGKQSTVTSNSDGTGGDDGCDPE